MISSTQTWIDRLPFEAASAWMPTGDPMHPSTIVLPAETTMIDRRLLLTAMLDRIKALIAMAPSPLVAETSLVADLTVVSNRMLWTEEANAEPLKALILRNPTLIAALLDWGLYGVLPAKPDREVLNVVRAAEIDPQDALERVVSALALVEAV